MRVRNRIAGRMTMNRLRPRSTRWLFEIFLSSMWRSRTNCRALWRWLTSSMTIAFESLSLRKQTWITSSIKCLRRRKRSSKRLQGEKRWIWCRKDGCRRSRRSFSRANERNLDWSKWRASRIFKPTPKPTKVRSKRRGNRSFTWSVCLELRVVFLFYFLFLFLFCYYLVSILFLFHFISFAACSTNKGTKEQRNEQVYIVCTRTTITDSKGMLFYISLPSMQPNSNKRNVSIQFSS